jgi:hypothetical protein
MLTCQQRAAEIYLKHLILLLENGTVQVESLDLSQVVRQGSSFTDCNLQMIYTTL